MKRWLLSTISIRRRRFTFNYSEKHIVSLAEAGTEDAALLGKMINLVPVLAKKMGCEGGFRTVINTGRDGGQEVPHLHIHVLGGPQPWK